MRNTDSLGGRAVRLVVSYPKAVLACFMICAALLGWQARHFTIDASPQTLLTKDNRHYIRSRLISRRFSPQEFLLIAYAPHGGTVFTKETFGVLPEIAEALRGLERVDSVRTILNVPIFAEGRGGMSVDTDPAETTIQQNDYDLEELRAIFRDHPIYEDLIINAEQTATAIQLLFKSDPDLEKLHSDILDLQAKRLDGELSAADAQQLARLKSQAEPREKQLERQRAAEIETIRELLVKYEEEADIYVGGLHVLAYQLIRIIRKDLMVFGAVIAVIVCLILAFLFRRGRWILIPVVCCTCSVLSTMGLFGMLGLKTTVISSNFIALQLILTLAIVIHLIVQYREYGADHPDWSQDRLVRMTLKRKAAPCFYAGITTSVGFGSLLFSNIQPVIAFGWMMIIAMAFSIGVSLVLFPALMALFPREKLTEGQRFSHFVLGLSRQGVLKHGTWIVAVSALLLVLGCVGALLLDVENSFLNYFKESTRVHNELSFIDREFGGTTPLDVVYEIPQEEEAEDLVLTAETLQTLERIQATLAEHDAVGKILSVVNFTELARQVNAGKPLTEYEVTALYWTMEESLRRDLLGSFFAPEERQMRFSVRIKDTTPGLDRAELLAQVETDLQGLGIPRERYLLTNVFVLYQDILQRLFRSQALTLGIVYAVLTLAFLVIFRSFKVALIGIMPNILTTVTVLGVMGWARIPLDLMTITIAAIAMGIAVDDTIHYIHRYLEEVENGSGSEAVSRTHDSVGYAVLYTTLIIIVGFSMLMFSDFVPSILFGLLTALAMALALAFDLTLLPVLLKRFVKEA